MALSFVGVIDAEWRSFANGPFAGRKPPLTDELMRDRLGSPRPVMYDISHEKKAFDNGIRIAEQPTALH